VIVVCVVAILSEYITVPIRINVVIIDVTRPSTLQIWCQKLDLELQDFVRRIMDKEMEQRLQEMMERLLASQTEMEADVNAKKEAGQEEIKSDVNARAATW
jgi:hypothetical protein